MIADKYFVQLETKIFWLEFEPDSGRPASEISVRKYISALLFGAGVKI